MDHSIKRLLSALLAFGLLPICAGRAAAANITVIPVQVYIPAGASSAVLTIQNQSTQPLRLQITGFAWDQNPNGTMKLTPSADLIFFPALVTVAPSDAQQIRIGIERPPDKTEQAFRIFVTQLPGASDVTHGDTVAVRMKIGVPVFVEPPHEKNLLAVNSASVKARKLSFALRNDGNVHQRVKDIKIVGMDAAGKAVFSDKAHGWYLLSGDRFDVAVPISNTACRAVRTISVTVTTDVGPFDIKNVPAGARSCN